MPSLERVHTPLKKAKFSAAKNLPFLPNLQKLKCFQRAGEYLLLYATNK